MVTEAVGKALEDAKIHHNEIQQACVGYVYGKIQLPYSRMTFL
jgi:hypothetical protein